MSPGFATERTESIRVGPDLNEPFFVFGLEVEVMRC